MFKLKSSEENIRHETLYIQNFHKYFLRINKTNRVPHNTYISNTPSFHKAPQTDEGFFVEIVECDFNNITFQ